MSSRQDLLKQVMVTLIENAVKSNLPLLPGVSPPPGQIGSEFSVRDRGVGD